MVIGAFPIAKLGTLLLRQVSKPIANVVKERAKSSHFFRTYICMPPAQFYNWCEVKAKMWVMNLGKPMEIPSLNEAMAIELGANLLGEGIIFAVAAGVLFLEYNRQTRKEAAKEEARKDELELLNYTIQDLYFTTEKQDAQIRELTRLVVDLECTVNHRTWLGGRSSTHRHHTNVEEAVGQNVDPQKQTKVVKNQSVVLSALSSLGYMPETHNSRQW